MPDSGGAHADRPDTDLLDATGRVARVTQSRLVLV
jgi:hypothetical protein